MVLGLSLGSFGFIFFRFISPFFPYQPLLFIGSFRLKSMLLVDFFTFNVSFGSAFVQFIKSGRRDGTAAPAAIGGAAVDPALWVACNPLGL